MSADAPPAADRPTPPGPRVWEAPLWALADFLLVQVLAGSAAFVAVSLAAPALIGRAATQEEAIGFGLPAVQLFAVAVGLAAFRLRCGPVRRLGWAAPAWPAVAVSVLAFPAQLIAGGQWAAAADRVWDRACGLAPRLRALDALSSTEQIPKLFEAVPLPVLLLGVAAGAACSEEIFCRGFLGRGLVARLGAFWGVAATAVIFCGLHLHPVHVVALVPFAVLVHVGYLSARSLWLPIGVHAANNGLYVLLGVLAVRTGQAPPADAEPPLSWVVLLYSTGLVAAGVWALWSVRLRAFDGEGREVTPRWSTADRPPAASGLRTGHVWEKVPLVLFGLGLLGSPVAAAVAVRAAAG